MSLTWIHRWEEPGKVVLLCSTNSQSLEEQRICFAQKALGTGLRELGYMFLGEVKENSRFFLTDNCFFLRKAQQIFWWVTHAFIVENFPDKALCWPEMTRPWYKVSVFRIYRIVIKSVQRGCHKKIQGLYFSTKININLSFSGKSVSFLLCFKPFKF